MKRNNLTTAVIAGLAGVAGVASISNAVNINNDGLGQVLIYPYYTVNNGYNTIMTVVNTTDQAKAVKVRFMEGKNTQEVLDFNLYLSAYDVWTAALAKDGTDVRLITADTSCTAPSPINGQVFLPFQYAGDAVGEDGVRKFEGHFEIIEMGPIVDPVTTGNVTHVGGTPPGCATVSDNWAVGSGVWDLNQAAADAVLGAPTGGLFGTASLINVTEGTDVSYDAVALEDFTNLVNHSSPGDLLPSIAQANPQVSTVIVNGTVVTTNWAANTNAISPADPVSALFMHDRVYNEYTVESVINADTEWVVTFPTKRFYVNPGPLAPFTTDFTENGACEAFGTRYWDREEGEPNQPPGTTPVSPLPPPDQPQTPVFCWEANVLSFTHDDAPTGPSNILGSNHNYWYSLGSNFNAGWVELSFAQSKLYDLNANGTPDPGEQQYMGLPVTGFSVQKYVNHNVGGGILANYAGLFQHKYRTVVNSL
jgi:hypothetical protein